MPKFKPMYRRNNSTRMNINTVCKDDSGYIWIDNKLKSGDVFTEIRILPLIDENGEELLALNPEGGASAEEIPATIGAWAACMEIASIWKNGKRTFVSAVQEHDRNGDPVPGGYTPVMKFMSKVGYKIYEQTQREKLGLDTDIPEHWYSWRENNTVSKPQRMYIARALTNYVNGEPVKDSMGNKEWIPGIFAIPKSAEERFVQDICTRLDPDEDLTLENNEFGDFYSCDNGCTLRLKRYDKVKDGRTRTFTTYSINKGRSMSLSIEDAGSMIKDWAEILNVPTVEDCIETLSQLFEPSAIDYAFRKSVYEKYLDDSIKGASESISEAGDVRKLSKDTETKATETEQSKEKEEERTEYVPAEMDQSKFKGMAESLKKQVGGLVE